MYEYSATVVNVVDGDTVDAIIDVGFKMTTKQRLRLNRINTLEVHDPDPVKRALAMEAKKYMIDTLLGEKVIVKTQKSDAFGRWLAEVYLQDVNINSVLLETNLAIPYKR